MIITRIFSQIPKALLLLVLASPLLAQQCQITSPLPVPITIEGCTYNANLPGGSTSYIQNTSSLQSGATAYPSFLYVASSATISTVTVSGLSPNLCVQTSTGGLLTTASAACGSGGGGGTPGGADTELQFNQSGSFGGSSVLIYDYAHARLGIGAAPTTYQLEITSDTVSGGFVGALMQNTHNNGNMGTIIEDNNGNSVQFAMAGPTFGAPLQSNAYIYTAGVGLQVFMSGNNAINFWTNGNEVLSITGGGNIQFSGTGVPTNGQALCLSGGELGHCTSIVGAGGGCTCSAP